MHLREMVGVLAAFLLSSPAALAGTEAVAPAGGGLGALAVKVDITGGRVLYQTCPQQPCAVGAQSQAAALGVDRSLLPPVEQVSAEVVSIAAGKHVVHVRVPLRSEGGMGAPTWEGVFAAGAEPLFTDVTGWTHGEPGERTGVALRWLEDAQMLVKGDVREDLRICGDDATLLKPQGLDAATLSWRGATLQRLPAARRSSAQRLLASARGGAAADSPLAPLLTAQGASTGVGEPKNLSDGDPETTWGEARPGQGQGEFVLFRAPHEVPVARFAIAVAPRAPKPEGAAPRTFYIATDSTLFEFTMPEDAWLHPGAAYDLPLPEPITTACVALVLGDAYTRGNPKPEVTIAELYAYSAFDGPGSKLESVAGALAGGGPRAEAAAGILKRAASPGLAAAAKAFGVLDAAGRALAVDVAAASPNCAASASLLVPALSDADEVVREKARAKLEQPHCGKQAVPDLVAALAAGTTRARAAKLLASVAPSQALAPLAGVMGAGSMTERAVVRSAFAHAAAEAGAAEIANLLRQAEDPEARVELLRASEARLADVRDVADVALEAVFAAAPPVRTRYLLAGPVAALARAGDAKQDDRLVALLEHDPEPLVRTHAAELAGGSAKAQAALDQAAKDPEPRVREAVFHTVTTSKVLGALGVASDALAGDPWTFVRVEAASALAALPASTTSDAALARALDDRAPKVRAAAITALAGHAARALAGPIRARLTDKREDLEVRVASAHALGALCDERAVDDLAGYAVGGASSPDPDEVALGLAATEALGRIHPADIAKRLKGIQSKGARPDARRAVQDAVTGPGTCR